jgi:hypothetical protein
MEGRLTNPGLTVDNLIKRRMEALTEEKLQPF